MDQLQVNGLNNWLKENCPDMGYSVNEDQDKGKKKGIRESGTQWIMVQQNGESTNMFITVDFYLKQVLRGPRPLY